MHTLQNHVLLRIYLVLPLLQKQVRISQMSSNQVFGMLVRSKLHVLDVGVETSNTLIANKHSTHRNKTYVGGMLH
jgi:hypothetical protein